MAAACATVDEAPAVEAATMAQANGTLPPTSGSVLAMALPTFDMAPSASKVAIASVPFKPMRSKDTSLPHSFQVDVAAFQKLAVLTAQARARWGAEAVRLAESGAPATPDQVARLTAARTAYDDLSEAYDGLRRMVERGYLPLRKA